MKKMTLLVSVAIAVIGLQSVYAAAPPVGAPAPVNYRTDDPDDFDVMGMFGEFYGESTTLSTPNWGQTATWDYEETGDGKETIIIKNLGSGIWLPIQLASQREIKKYSYVHIDIFCNEATDFRFGFHTVHPTNVEEYFSLIHAGDMTPGQWYSIEYALSDILSRPTWSSTNNANYLRFGQNPDPTKPEIANLEPATYSNEIYVTNMFVFNGTPTCLAGSGVNNIAVENVKIYVDKNAELHCNQAFENITVYNVAGQKAGSFQSSDNLNLSGLAAGIYLVKARLADGKIVSQKVIR